MSDSDRTLILGLALLALWYWKKPAVTVQGCIFPDGTETLPIDGACPYDASHGGQSTPKTL